MHKILLSSLVCLFAFLQNVACQKSALMPFFKTETMAAGKPAQSDFYQSEPASAGEMLNGLGFEFQAYPTGLIPGIKYERYISPLHGLHLRVGYNWVRHGSAGVHEDERGQGFGFTAGYRRYLSDYYGKTWFIGARGDVWFNSLDWRDGIGGPNEINGNSKVTVVQPTLEGGYRFILNGGELFFEPSLAFGFEFNVKTKGEKVGEGPILLGGISLGRFF